MDITLKINDVLIPGKDGSTFIYKPHDRYYIKNVSVIPEYDPSIKLPYDTIDHIIRFHNNKPGYPYQFLYNQKIRIKPSAFNSAIKIKPENPFSARDLQSTYRKLFNYRIIRTAKINFDTTGAGQSNDGSYKYLNAQIMMQNSRRHSVSFEGFGTNSSGDLGIRGKLTYLNKNIFKHAEIFRIRVIGGFEAQSVGSVDSTSSSGIFNTFEVGIDGTVFFPRFLFPLRLASKLSNCKKDIQFNTRRCYWLLLL
jgi:outer membrane protein assembly factor BamA